MLYNCLSEPLAVLKTSLETLSEGLDPVVSQHHRLRQAEVELFLWGQIHTTGPGFFQQLL